MFHHSNLFYPYSLTLVNVPHLASNSLGCVIVDEQRHANPSPSSYAKGFLPTQGYSGQDGGLPEMLLSPVIGQDASPKEEA